MNSSRHAKTATDFHFKVIHQVNEDLREQTDEGRVGV